MRLTLVGFLICFMPSASAGFLQVNVTYDQIMCKPWKPLPQFVNKSETYSRWHCHGENFGNGYSQLTSRVSKFNKLSDMSEQIDQISLYSVAYI